MVFILSLQDMEGDNKVVNIIEDWAVLAEYAGEKLGFTSFLATMESSKLEYNQAGLDSRKSLIRATTSS